MSGFYTRIRNFLEAIFGKTDEPIDPERKESQYGLTFEKAKERADEEERVRLEEEAEEQEKSQEKNESDNDDFQDVIVDDEKLAEIVEPELIEEISERRKSVEKKAKLRLEDIEDE